jgi:hypothetical protein
MNRKKATTFILILAAGILILAGLAISPASSRAAVTENSVTNLDITVYIPCTGNSVELTGPLHTLITYTENGNNISGMFHFQPQDVKGTDTVSGALYEATGVTRESFETSLQNGVSVDTFINNFRIIGQGQAQNYLVHETTHITFNAAGIQSVTHDNFSSECK